MQTIGCRLLLIGALGINMLSSTMLIVSALPRHVRATDTSMIYAFGVTLFGGSAQPIVTWLLDVSGNPLAPAWFVTGRQPDSHSAVPGAPHRVTYRSVPILPQGITYSEVRRHYRLPAHAQAGIISCTRAAGTSRQSSPPSAARRPGSIVRAHVHRFGPKPTA